MTSDWVNIIIIFPYTLWDFCISELVLFFFFLFLTRTNGCIEVDIERYMKFYVIRITSCSKLSRVILIVVCQSCTSCRVICCQGTSSLSSSFTLFIVISPVKLLNVCKVVCCIKQCLSMSGYYVLYIQICGI